MTRLILSCPRCLRDHTFWSGGHLDPILASPVPPDFVEAVTIPPRVCPWCGWHYRWLFPYRPGYQQVPPILFQNLPPELRPYEQVIW